MKKNILPLLSLIIAYYLHSSALHAQDPHFSQYFASPMTLNPALIGKNINDWRAMAIFRSQWWGSNSATPFYTTSASVEKKIYTGSINKSSLSIGLSLLSDASNGGLLKNNYFTSGGAYNLALDQNGNELLGLGLQVTYANRLLDAAKFQFQSQFGSMGFQRSTPSGDPVSILTNHYIDVNAGVHYSKNFPESWGYQLGFALFHAGKPKEGVFSNSTYSIDRRISLQAGLLFYLSNKNEIQISSLNEMQGKNTIFTFGAVYKAKINDHNIQALHLGVWNRFKDALYPYVGLETKNWLIGISYDIINPDIRSTHNSVQSMEFSVLWHFTSKKNIGIHSNTNSRQ